MYCMCNALYFFFLMKKLFILVIFLSAFSSSIYAVDFSIVLEWMHTNDLTKYSTQAEFRWEEAITRGESSKFVDQYAQFMQLDKTYSECEFNDITDYDSTLIPHIKEACAYGLLKWSGWNFMPNNNLTEAQWITMVMRSLYGFQDETGDPRYSEYATLAAQAGIISDIDMSSLAGTVLTREKLWTWFYAAAHLWDSDTAMAKSATELAVAIEQWEPITPKTNTVAWPNGYMVYDETKVEKALAAGQKVYLYFHADRCPSCRILDKALSAETNFPKNLVVFKINFDTATTLTTKYGITQQHTVIKINKNKDETHRNTTATNLNDIMEVWGYARI